MALIGKIREKTGWTIGIIAVGLILFIVGGDILSPNSIIKGNNERNLAVIAGQKIPIPQYDSEMNELKYTYFLNTGKTPTAAEDEQFAPQAWNSLIFKTAFQKEFDALGLVVGKEEQIDMVQGRNIHPAIFQSFRNQQTGQFDKAMIINYLQNIPKMDQKQQAIWYNFEKQLAPDRLRLKYEALIKKTTYVTTAEAKREYIAQNTKAEAKFLFIPYSVITDTEIQLTDAVISEYFDKNKAKFPTDASANLEYVAFPIIASKSDTVSFFAELAEIKKEFKESTDDSLYSALSAENPIVPSWMNPGELPKALTKFSNLTKDSVYGPVLDGTTYKMFKIGNAKNDTAFAARASHILFRWDSESAEDKAKALAKCKDVLAKIKKGDSFEMMASQFGTDGTAQQGGDLGWFGQGRMVKEFEKVVFASTAKGLIPEPVETQFGYHILKVTETKTNKKYFVSQIDKTITAGEDTRDSVYSIAEKVSIVARDGGIDAYVKTNPTVQKLFAPNVTSSAPAINNLQNPKELLRWVFTEGKEGDVSSVFEISDNFVVSSLKNKYDKGKVNIEAMKYQVSYQVANELKAAKIIEKIGADNTNLDDAAKKIGNNLVVSQASDLSVANPVFSSAGYEPEAAAKAVGLKVNTTSKPLIGNGGVIMVQPTAITKAPESTDYNMLKSSLLNAANSRNEYFINEAIREKADIEDNRYKYY